MSTLLNNSIHIKKRQVKRNPIYNKEIVAVLRKITLVKGIEQ